MNKIKGQAILHIVQESSQMAEDDIDFRAENNSNLYREIGFYDEFRDFKRSVTIKFQEIKQQTTEITYDKTTCNAPDIKRS